MRTAIFVLTVLSATFALCSGAAELLTLRNCGRTRACWSFPPGCNDATCDGIVKWDHRGNSIVFEWQAKDIGGFENGRYSSFGFSEDRFMGDDTVIECVFNPAGQGQVFVSFNGGSYNTQLQGATQRVLKSSYAALKNGKMVCGTEFMLDAARQLTGDDRKRVHDLDGKPYFMQYAKGLADPTTGEKQIHSLDDGELYPWTTTKKVTMCRDCPDRRTIVTGMAQ